MALDSSGPLDTRPFVEHEEDIAQRSITFEDLGIPRIINIRNTVFGSIRTFQSLFLCEWGLLVVGLFFLLTTVAFAIQRFFYLQPGSTDYIFDVLLIFNSVFCILYLLNGVFREQGFEIMALAFSSVTIIICVGIHFNDAGTDYVFRLIRLILTASLGGLTFIFGSYCGYDYLVSSRLIFRLVGADATMQRMCFKLFTATTLLLFNLQNMGSLVILSFVHGFVSMNLQELLTIVIGIPWLGAWTLLAYISLRRESSALLLSGILLSPVQLVYMILVMTQTILHNPGQPLASYRFVIGGSAVGVYIILIIMLYYSSKNFGQGLRQLVYASRSQSSSSR